MEKHYDIMKDEFRMRPPQGMFVPDLPVIPLEEKTPPDRFGMRRPERHRFFTFRNDPRFMRYECSVKLLYEELEYDVRYAVWKRGQMAGVAGAEASRLYEMTEEDNDWMLRRFSSAAADIRKKLSWALKKDNRSRMASDELLAPPTEWNFIFLFEKGWEGSPEVMMNAMHGYIVNKTISEWFKASDMATAAVYADMADNDLRTAYNEMDNYHTEPPVFRL